MSDKDEVPIRKFDGQPISMLPTTVILYRNGDLCCDATMPDCPVLFPDELLAEAHLRLCTRKNLRAKELGVKKILEIVKNAPGIDKVCMIFDMGELHSSKGKLQRTYYSAYLTRPTFLESIPLMMEDDK